MAETVTIQPTETGALVLVGGSVRATFTGDLGTAEAVAALEELLRELFDADLPAIFRSK
jgi:hypothetical protein